MFYWYLLIFIAISGAIPSKYAIVIFVLVRVLQGYFMGLEIASIVNFASLSLSRKYHSFLYYFIVFSSELGTLVCIFFNRLLVTHDIGFVVNDKSWELQTIIGAGFAMMLAFARFMYPLKQKSFYSFTVWNFVETIKHDGVNILLRSTIVLCHVLLIFAYFYSNFRSNSV